LASLTGMSASFLSQFERGKTGASTSTLMQIANALGISVADLFDERATSTHRVLKRAMRPALPISDGYRKTLLSQRPLQDFEVYVGEFEVGGSTGDEPYTHGNSHEMVLVLRGVIQVELSGVRHVLEEGDSLEYPTSTPHRAANIGNARAEVMWIISPPTTSPQYLDQYVTWEPPNPA
jgi:transcriptional regulator with XRE-family HTH domain